MKNIKLIKIIFVTVAVCSRVSASAPQTLYSNEVYQISQVVGPILQSLGSIIENNKNPKVKTVANALNKAPLILQDGYSILVKAEQIVTNINQFERNADILKNQFNCLAGKANMAGGLCVSVNCQNKKACISATIKTIQAFLRPLIDSLFGYIEIDKDGNKKLMGGVLIIASESVLIPEGKRYPPTEKQRLLKSDTNAIKEKLVDFTMKLNAAYDFLSVLSFIINPEIPVKELTPAQQKELIQDNPIDISMEDEFVLEDLPEIEEEPFVAEPVEDFESEAARMNLMEL